jgi:hypothetical protein
MSITVAPLTTTVMNAVPTDQSGVASGVNNAVSRAAALLALAVFGLLMATTFDAALAQQLSAIGLDDATRRLLQQEAGKLAAAEIPKSLGADQASAVRDAIQQSFVTGFRWVMGISAALAALSALSAFVLIDARPRER